MGIEEFLKQSEGEWISMRSAHSLAFKQFENIESNIQIKILTKEDKKIKSFLQENNYKNNDIFSAFEMSWEGISTWNNENNPMELSGNSILIVIKKKQNTGLIIRSVGYTEKIQAISNYSFISDGTIILSTTYNETIAEERIWFISKNVRCRSSVIKSLNKEAILQTSFASEIRKSNN